MSSRSDHGQGRAGQGRQAAYCHQRGGARVPSGVNAKVCMVLHYVVVPFTAYCTKQYISRALQSRYAGADGWSLARPRLAAPPSCSGDWVALGGNEWEYGVRMVQWCPGKCPQSGVVWRWRWFVEIRDPRHRHRHTDRERNRRDSKGIPRGYRPVRGLAAAAWKHSQARQTKQAKPGNNTWE